MHRNKLFYFKICINSAGHVHKLKQHMPIDSLIQYDEHSYIQL